MVIGNQCIASFQEKLSSMTADAEAQRMCWIDDIRGSMRTGFGMVPG